MHQHRQCASVKWTSETKTKTSTRKYQLWLLPYRKEGSRIVAMITLDLSGTIEKVTYTYKGGALYDSVEVEGLGGRFRYDIKGNLYVENHLNITTKLNHRGNLGD